MSFLTRATFPEITMRAFFVLLVAGAASVLSSPSDDVIELTASNFKTEVINSDDVWMVEFYAPWCGHCKALAPEWRKAAAALKGIVKVGAVDMDIHASVGSPYNVRGFPTIKVFGADKDSPSDYQGARTAAGIVDEAMKAAKNLVNSRLSGSGFRSGGGSGGSGGKSDVVELTDSNFEEKVLNSNDLWLVEFFAPWCGHCKRLAPEFGKAATELKGKVKLGAVDATVHTVISSRFQVQGYPTLKFFGAGKKSFSDADEYDGGRTASDIVSWCMSKVQEALPPPEVYELTEQQVLDEACQEHPLCVLSFLPDILDTGAEGRNQYLATLKGLGEKYKNKNWGWVWTAAGQQAKVEEALGIGGFGYPALSVLNYRKKVSMTLKGSFSKEGINEFLRAVAVGRGSTEKLRGEGLPSVVAVEAWDGKDGVLPEEDDIDLSDFDMDDDEDAGKDEL
ncbi:protein disulfide-isomerase A6 homolog [Diadema antillarum]|uniref:protein disulfide-isomerase A6 homolog n=1 Tax=Diadema antillarum TaxID=105358 RepID=UPI003A878A61